MTATCVDSMFFGLAKSMLLQFLMSMVMASGIIDGWLVKPHFKSKKIDLLDKFKNCLSSEYNIKNDTKMIK